MNNFSIRSINLSFAYEPGTNVLCEVNMSINPGEITVFCGGNGTGKTTMMKLIAGLYVPDTGKVIYLDESGNELNSDKVKLNSIYVHQEPYILKGTVFSNISLLLHSDIRKSEKSGIISRSLELTGLSGFEKKKASNLSGGEKKRLAISRALAAEKRVLMLDEPTANLDDASSKKLGSHLLKLKSTGVTIVISTHDKQFMEKIADNVFDFDVIGRS